MAHKDTRDRMERLAEAMYITLREEFPLSRESSCARATERLISLIKVHAMLARMERGNELNVACDFKDR